MKLKDMADKPSSKGKGLPLAMPATMPEKSGPQYPWSLRITFGEDQIARLEELADVKAGQYVTITARCKVLASRSEDIDDSERGGTRKSRSVEMQIREVAVDDSETLKREFDEGEKPGDEED